MENVGRTVGRKVGRTVGRGVGRGVGRKGIMGGRCRAESDVNEPASSVCRPESDVNAAHNASATLSQM